MSLERILPPYSEADPRYTIDLARSIQSNFEKLNKFTLKDTVSGTLVIDLGSGAGKKVTIEVLNGLIVAITAAAGSSAGITWTAS